MNRSKSYYREQRKKAIKKKMNIVKSKSLSLLEEHLIETHGRLSKGKIHCSCPLCANKSRIELKASEKRKLERDINRIDEYLDNKIEGYLDKYAKDYSPFEDDWFN